MKAHICDICHTQDPIGPDNTYDLPPVGWYTVSKHSDSSFSTLHLCGSACLATHAGAELSVYPQPTIEEAARG